MNQQFNQQLIENFFQNYSQAHQAEASVCPIAGNCCSQKRIDMVGVEQQFSAMNQQFNQQLKENFFSKLLSNCWDLL